MIKTLVLGLGIGLGLAIGIMSGLTYAADVPQGQESNSIQEFKQDRIIFSTHTPNKSDKGFLWVKYNPASDATMDIYVRNPLTGAWRSVQAS